MQQSTAQAATDGAVPMMNADGFLTRFCGRCGGSGRYSFNLMDGDRCFGCSGSGVVFTREALEARKFMHESRLRAVEDIKPGDLVRLSHGEKWRTVVAVDAPDRKHGGQVMPDGSVLPFGMLRTKKVNHAFLPGQRFESVRGKDEQMATLAAAIAYQAALIEGRQP